MANYYYLGRSAFPDILIWVTISVIIGGAGLVTMMAGMSASSAASAEQEMIKDQLQALDHEFNGGNLESAMQALTKFKSVKGLGAKENFIKDILLNARLERRHARKMLSMLADGKKDEEIQTWLESQIKPGLNPLLTKEQALISLYDGLINGTDKIDELSLTLKSDSRIPQEIVEMAEGEGFDFMEGARARLNFFKGHNGNARVQLDDLIRQEETAHLKTDEKYESRITLLPELRNSYFEKSRKLDEELAKNQSSQSEAWSAFLKETKDMVAQRRKSDLLLYEKEQELKVKESLLVKKVEGQDWIPPLDLIDGQILVSDMNSGLVTIDIGRADALREGQKFDVFKVKGDVLQEKKGRLEVINLSQKIAVCRVLESKVLDPIVAGDVIANGENDYPFDRKLSPTYVLSGQFLKSYSKDLVAFLIESSGGDIKTKLHKNINYMVIGDKPDEEEIKICRQLGVRTIRVRDIPMHLGYSLSQVEQIKKQNWN